MRKKTFTITFIVVMYMLVIIIVLIFRPTREERTERHFIRDYELLITIAQFLADYPNENIHIWRSEMERGEINFPNVRSLEFEDVVLVEAFKELANRGYNMISKCGNTITFQRWANRHIGWGMAFSIDGSKPERSSVTITTLEPLSRPNWYFYVSR